MIIAFYYYFKRKKNKAAEKSKEALERIQIREYGHKINEETRSKSQK